MSTPTRRIYVATAPGYDVPWTRTNGATTRTGRGLFKVGQTDRPTSDVRIKELTGTLFPTKDGVTIHLDEPGVREDGTVFTDTDIHHVLDAAGIHRDSEVVQATLDEIRAAIVAVRTRAPYDPARVEDFRPRQEQEDAVEATLAYFTAHADAPRPPRFLWNAKMRFGKTFTAYQLAKRAGWTRVLVLTYKPAARDQWRDDLNRHAAFAGWRFADRETPADPTDPAPLVWFTSFQDLLGTTAAGDIKAHNVDLHEVQWDCVIVDEYHFGAWQGAAREVCSPADTTTDVEDDATTAEALSDLTASGDARLVTAGVDTGTDTDVTTADLRLRSARYLYLSGTPFRALTEGEFTEDAIFNWTYPDEQEAKETWTGPGANPYQAMPRMELFTYTLPSAAQAGFETEPVQEFSLSKYFEAKKVGSEYHFTDPARVAEFLNMIRGKLPATLRDKILTGGHPLLPYADGRFAGAIDHTVWFMPTVASARAMAATLATHPYFRDFRVHVAAGSDTAGGAAAKAPVVKMLDKAIQSGQQTITLSVGKLMTGVTVPQWGAILVLRTLKAPESYFQAAFRVQSAWQEKAPNGSTVVRKPTCYVFDFDPGRALSLIYQYGTKLAAASRASTPGEEIADLIKFLPIFAFDGASMSRVDVNEVMTWGTSGVGAAMLARRWASPRLVNLSDDVLTRLLGNAALLARLEQMEDFRALRAQAGKILTSSRTIRTAKHASPAEPESPEITAERRERAAQIKDLRDKLLKLTRRIPVFMYLTDYREESLVHVIESLDTQLFERVTGLTIADFHELSSIGVFAADHMEAAIYQFRLFELPSLAYLNTGVHLNDTLVGGWQTRTTRAQLEAAADAQGDREVWEALIATGMVSVGGELHGSDGDVATIAEDHGLVVNGVHHPTLATTAAEPWDFWHVPGWGTLRELADLLDP